MRIFDETKTIELENVDFKKGYLKEDVLITTVPSIAGITVAEKVKKLKEQGKKVVEIQGNMYEVLFECEKGQTVSRIIETPAVPTHDEIEQIRIYVPFTEEELENNSNINYKKRVETLIRERYSLSDELAILRQRDSKPEEFEEYNNYAESCKLRAKEEIEEENEYEY